MRAEKIVLTSGPAGGRRALTRARVLTTAQMTRMPTDDMLTEIGRALLACLALADGVEVITVLRHGVLFQTVHPELWSWDEVEAAVVAAFTEALGTPLDVVRED
jgi:hypothetical protein